MIKGDFNSPFSVSAPIDQNGFSLLFDVAAFAANSTISGVISGLGGLTKFSSGVLEFSANSTPQYLTIDGGTVQVTGSLSCPVGVYNNSLLVGSGTVGDVTVNNASIEPRLLNPDFTQASPTTLAIGSFHTITTVHLSFQITDTVRSRLDVHGALFFDGTLFIASQFSQHPFHAGDQIVLISNDGTDPVRGEFQGAPEGWIVSGSPIPLRITYHGGDGNDVAVIADSFAPAFAVGAAAGGFPLVNSYNADGGYLRTILAYEPSFRGGVHVVTADMTGDGIPDVITAPGVGGGPVIRIWDGNDGHLAREFNAYDPSFRGGVRVATGDLTGDGVIDIVTAPGPGGGPHVRVWDGATGALVREFNAYDLNFHGGVFVAVGDVNGDGTPDIITGAGPGGGPHVKAFSGRDGSFLISFFAYDLSFRGGVSVAAGDLFGNGHVEVVTGAGPDGGPHVKVYDLQYGVYMVRSFFAYDPGFRGGVSVAAGDTDGDGAPDIITGPGAGLPPRVRSFNGFSQAPLLDYLTYTPAFNGGITVAALGLSTAAPAIITGAGPGGGPHVKAFSNLAVSPPVLDFSLFAFDPAFVGGIYVG
jgi:hypothetical protein